VSGITGLETSRDRAYFALEMSWFEQADQFWTLGQTRFEAGSMAKPGLPFSLLCFNRQVTRIYFALSDTIAAEATWSPLDCDFALRYIFTHGANYTGRPKL
jgi:hypothetical protein